MILALCVVLAALWLVAAYGFYKENERAKYDVEISPGSVSYGTHSTALMPMTVNPHHPGQLPMISGNTIRRMAHSGHAAEAQISKQEVHATSSAAVRHIGSGILTENRVGTYSTSRKSERGITQQSVSIPMPMMVWNSTSALAHAGFNLRKAKPTTSGTEGEWRNGGGGDGDWWRCDEGEWTAAQEGDTRPAGGDNYWLYTGGTWILVNNMGDPVVPVGATPWLLMLGLALVYVLRKKERYL